jgi:hypothetical protein
MSTDFLIRPFKPATILTYSLESTIAEKFEALIQRLQLTSRMKDIYDIYYLSNQFDFDGNRLQQAIWQTLINRGTFYEDDSLDKVIALANDPDIQVRWRQFLTRARLPELNLDQVFSIIEDFLRPVWTSIVQSDSMDRAWGAHENTWESPLLRFSNIKYKIKISALVGVLTIFYLYSPKKINLLDNQP